MGKKVIISADTTCDLTPELLNRYQIQTVPLYVTFGEESYRDGIEITPDEIYKRYETEGVLPKTAACPIDTFGSYFEGLLKKTDQVVHCSLSSELSSTYQNAVIAAQEFPGRVFVVDTMNLSTGEGLIILRGAELAAQGKEAEEIQKELTIFAKQIDASFIIESLEFLHKGGRCSTLAALGANLLSIKPCIEVKNGKLDVGKKYRGKFQAVLQKYIDERLADADYDTSRIFVTHAGCAEEIVALAKQLVEEKNIFKEILVTRAGCTISSHCGPDTLGILFARTHEI